MNRIEWIAELLTEKRYLLNRRNSEKNMLIRDLKELVKKYE